MVGARPGWQPTQALARAAACGLTCLVLALLGGRPELLVLGTPFLLHAALALVHRPTGSPRPTVAHRPHTLHEGQATTSRLVGHVGAALGDEVEQVTRSRAAAAYVQAQPASGAVTGPADDPPALVVRALRWGRLPLGEEKVALLSRWAGFRWGPVALDGGTLEVLPGPAPYDSRASVPRTAGLVGPHHARRPGSGTELEGIRPFTVGDRLRRIDWRVSLRTGELHVVSTDAEQDAQVQLVLDASADLGVSGGVEGAASSLDLGVRAAASLADHHVRRGDRVGLTVLGSPHLDLPARSGTRALHRLRATLAAVTVPRDAGAAGPWRVRGDEVVYLLSPLLDPAVAGHAALLSSRGTSVVVVDVLGEGEPPTLPDGPPPDVMSLAWRMRRLEREEVVRALASAGCPVVPWRGPGTVDEVLRRLARRAQLPRVRTR